MSQEDRAQDEEAFLWELRNSGRQVAKEFEPGEKGYGPAQCTDDDCGEDMPELRRRRGCKLCTTCQDAADKRAKRGY